LSQSANPAHIAHEGHGIRDNIEPEGQSMNIALWIIQGLLAVLLLAALGIYGVLSYSVTQRTREIGLRMALGASARETVGFVVRHSMLLIGAGVGVGCVAAALLARSMVGMLYGVGAFDLTAFVVAGLVLATVGFSASLVPARRAVRIDPMVALREQ
jgi:ABC-type antimicrobial peptide transport system permease subunit